jgi:HAD superfamily hydrolase (TIGR01509 family)
MTPSAAARLLSRKRLLIFDLDGTIVDSSPIHARAFEEAFAHLGVRVDYASIAGLTTRAAVDHIAATSGLALSSVERDLVVADKQSRAIRLIESGITAIEGAVEFIHAAQGRFALSLCTSASRASAEASLTRIGLSNCFEPVITAELVRHGKPDPEAFLLALDAHQVSPAEALVFEDAPSGLAAAAAAGIEGVRIYAAAADGSSWAPFLKALEV